MNILDIPCLAANHGGKRTAPVSYLVVHYTGCPEDTAVNEGRYFAANDTGKTSAHYFVDERQIVRSVPEDTVAYHCGAQVYRHPRCRNGNSIGVELCTKKQGDAYCFAPKTAENAKALLRDLMQKYGVPVQNVVRHYDVTGKLCPAPFVGAGQKDWEQFKGGLTVYHTLEEVPAWARPVVEKLLKAGFLQGEPEDLALSYDLIRLLVILDRAGVFGKEEYYVN